MTNQEDIIIEEIDYKDFSQVGKNKWVHLLKFYLFPTYRNPEFTAY